MNKAMKWILAIAAGIAVLIVIAVVVISMVFDVEKYKPQIEQQVAKATGRSFKLGGELKPSIFPWIGVRLEDLHLGNPTGFEEKDFVSVASFEVRVKLMPLLSRKIEVKRFVVNRPKIVLEKRKDGKGGWEDLGPPAKDAAPAPQPSPESEKSPADSGALPIESLLVGEFAITDGLIVWLDQASGVRKEVKEINLKLTNVSFDNPIGLAFSAVADEKPLQVDGTIGPLGKTPGKSAVPMEIALKLIDQLDIKLSGRVDPSAAPPTFEMAVDVAQFSPRQLMKQLGMELPVQTADAGVLNAVAAKLTISGSPEKIAVSKGELKLDDSTATFSANASEFDKPNLKMRLDLDRIDVDRYLPPQAEGEADAAPEKSPSSASDSKIDYEPLRRLVLDAQIKTGEWKVKNARMQDISVKVTARNGIIQLDPLQLNLYQGKIASTGTVNVQKDQPATSMKLSVNSVQAGPLVKDLLAKELIEGAMAAAIDLNFTGDGPDRIRQTLSGNGNLQFNDGAIVGIDLASMVRNVKTAFGLAEKVTEKPRTDFAELKVPFTLTNGLFNTKESSLNSPLMRVLAAGSTDLAKETLDFRVEPKFVATIKGQGDETQRSGLMVPVIISGNYKKPKFQPDLKSIIGQQIGQPLPDKESLKKMLPSGEDTKKKVEEGVKGLIKGLPFGQKE